MTVIMFPILVCTTNLFVICIGQVHSDHSGPENPGWQVNGLCLYTKGKNGTKA